MENEVNNIMLLDEDGKETEFEVVTKFDIANKEYLIVTPLESKEDDVAIALRIDKDENGEDVLVTVEDEDEFAMVSEAYETLFDEDDGELN